MSQDKEEIGGTVDAGINKAVVKGFGALLSVMLAIIGFFVVRVLNTVEAIAADNARFNTYIASSSLRMDGFERDVAQLKADRDAMKKEQQQQSEKDSERWAEFWRNYGAILPSARSYDKRNH